MGEGGVPGSDGWTTTEVAAAALRISSRQVRNLINGGDLVGRQVKRGRARPWEVDIASLKRERDRRVALGQLEESEATGEIPAGGYEEADRTEGVARAFERVARELSEASSRAAVAEERLQITAQAESTLRQQIDRLEKENARLRKELDEERTRPIIRRIFG